MPNTENNIEENGIPELTFTVEASNSVQTAVDKTLSIAEMAAEAKATGDAIASLESAVSDLNTDLRAVGSRTGADIPLNSSDTKTIENAIDEIALSVSSESHPVGSVFISINDDPPNFDGTWIQIAIPMTWGDAKNGTRNYRAVKQNETTGAIKFWLRVA